MSSTLPRPHPEAWPRTRSAALLDRAREVIPGLTSSMMKRPEHFAPDAFPAYLASGRGALVTDADGHEYVDFVCGLGATALGHGHPALLEAAQRALADGFVHSLAVEAEVEATEALLACVPGADMARFFKSGAEATSAAIRLARAITGKAAFLHVGYSGWHDHFMFDTPGVPAPLGALTERRPLFRAEDEAPLLAAVAERGHELAAVLVALPYNRPVGAAFLTKLREACTAHGVLLVFDEIVMGFRLALSGAQGFFGVRPDLSCFSKALANGMPLSAVVGPRDHMAVMGELQVSTTFGGELISLAVCRAALEVYRSTDHVERLHRLGRTLREGVDDAAQALGAPLRILGYDPLPFFAFAPDPARHAPLARAFQGHMARRGVLLRRDLNFICGAHDEAQIAFTVEQVKGSLHAMREAGAFEGAEA